jgi:hypothetical protein
MKTYHPHVWAFAFCASLLTGALAEDLSKAKYKSNKESISAQHKAEVKSCDSLASNAKDICKEEAKAKQKIAMAELESAYEPSVKNTYKVRVAKAEGAYAIAKERCDDQSGNAKDVCVKEAMAVKTTALADAKVSEKTADAKATEKEKISDANQDAMKEKIAAQYKLAVEKCDTYSGAAKDKCVAEAKLQYAK